MDIVLVRNINGMTQPCRHDGRVETPTKLLGSCCPKVLVQLWPTLDLCPLQYLYEAGTEIRLWADCWLQNEFTIFWSLCSPCLQLLPQLWEKRRDTKFPPCMTLRFLAVHKYGSVFKSMSDHRNKTISEGTLIPPYRARAKMTRQWASGHPVQIPQLQNEMRPVCSEP
jgi:hypothetical protein